MKTVLITGVAGFIGSNLASALLGRGHRVVGIDNFDDAYDPAFKEQNLAPLKKEKHFAFEKLDVRDADALEALVAREKPECVFHLAAKVDTRKAVEAPAVYIEVNIEGTLNVLEASRKAGVRRVVIASSSSVYGNDTNVPWREDAPAHRPLSPYGATKRASELLAHTYHHNFGMEIACLRYFNAYGENNRPGMVPYRWTEALLKGEEIELSGAGTRKRDYTYIGDIVRGTIAAMTAPLTFEVINLGNNRPLSLVELLAALERATGKRAVTRSRSSHPASVETTCADISKAKRLLDWEPEVSLDEGLARLVAWFRANRLENPK